MTVCVCVWKVEGGRRVLAQSSVSLRVLDFWTRRSISRRHDVVLSAERTQRTITEKSVLSFRKGSRLKITPLDRIRGKRDPETKVHYFIFFPVFPLLL